jgi:hypothetical protein
MRSSNSKHLRYICSTLTVILDASDNDEGGVLDIELLSVSSALFFGSDYVVTMFLHVKII